MKGLTHLFCAFAYAGAGMFVAAKWGALSAIDSIAFLLAAPVGALLPDVDAPSSLGTRLRFKGGLSALGFAARSAALMTRYFLYFPLKLLLLLSGKNEGHRGIMHSFRGILLVGAFWLGAGWLFLNYFHLQPYLRGLLLAMAGLLSGYAMHLWHDSLTVSGVRFSSGIKISGWLKTGRHEYLLQLFFLIISAFSAHLSNSVSPFFGLTALLFALPASFLLFGR